MRPTNIPLTLGDEIETVVAYKEDRYGPYRDGVYEAIAQDLTATDIPASPGCLCNEDNYDETTIVPDESIQTPAPKGKMAFESVEVRTRKLSTRDIDTASTEIYETVEVLNQRWQACPNESTGLHVHVGVEGEWSLGVVKNLASLVVGFEHLINEIIPDRRLYSSGGREFQSGV